jgi:uncharacterized protein (DUF427 family)
MPRAGWKGAVFAEAAQDAVEIVEGDVWFPPDAVGRQYVRRSDTRTACPWKGTASYYHVVVDVEENRDAAWYHSEPKARDGRC